MRIAVAGGRTEAVFLAEMLLKKNYFIVLINSDTRFCESIAAKLRKPESLWEIQESSAYLKRLK